MDIERIQKCAAKIILGERYISYRQALKTQSLQSRSDKLCLNFAKKAEKHTKFQKWFKHAHYSQDTDRKSSSTVKYRLSTTDLKKAP